jgi:hypothetical protein
MSANRLWQTVLAAKQIDGAGLGVSVRQNSGFALLVCRETVEDMSDGAYQIVPTSQKRCEMKRATRSLDQTDE